MPDYKLNEGYKNTKEKDNELKGLKISYVGNQHFEEDGSYKYNKIVRCLLF